MTITCIISDLDGTLVANEHANFAAYQHALKSVGRDLTQAAYAAAFGLRADAMLQQVAPGLTAAEIEDVRRRKAAYYHEHLHAIIVNKPLLNFLRMMKPQVKLALATTASRENADAVLCHIGAENLFDELVFGDDVKQGKPDPECYILAMQRCGALPEECLIFEDTETGLAAAKASGAQVVMVGKWDIYE